MYMMYSTFYDSGQDCNLSFQTWDFGLKTLMLSWKCLRKKLVSSGVPLIKNWRLHF